MNVERLHAIAQAVSTELHETEEVTRLANLVQALRQMVQEPAQPAHQATVSTIRTDLSGALQKAASNEFSPTWRATLEELGFADLLGNGLRDRLDAIFVRNEITPSAAADELEPIAARVQEVDNSLDNLLQALEFFDIGAEELDAGDFEIGFLIPRSAVDDEFARLGREFQVLKKLLDPFNELATGSRPDIKVRSISSSAFQVFLESPGATAVLFAKALDSVLNSYERILNIRKMHRELANDDVPDEVLDQLAAHVNERMKADVKQLAQELIAEANLADQGRANELETEIATQLRVLANKIDRGYGVEVRAGELPPPDEDDEDEDEDTEKLRQAAALIMSMQERLQFMNVSGEPILGLPEGADTEDPGNGPDEDPDGQT